LGLPIGSNFCQGVATYLSKDRLATPKVGLPCQR